MARQSTLALRCDRHLHGRLVAADDDGGPYLEIVCRHCRKDGEGHDHRWDLAMLLSVLTNAEAVGRSPAMVERSKTVELAHAEGEMLAR